MLKERAFKESILLLLPVEDGKIDQNVDCCYIPSLNKGKYYILVLYLTHIAQINDRSKEFVVERILRDPAETCVLWHRPLRDHLAPDPQGIVYKMKMTIITLHWYMATKQSYFLYFCTI